MTTATLTPHLSARLRRRVIQAAEAGWLVRIDLDSCERVHGSIGRIDHRAGMLEVCDPTRICASLEFGYEDIQDIEIHTAAFLRDGLRVTRCAIVAPWRGGSGNPDEVVADIIAGSPDAATAGPLLMPDGSRHRGEIVRQDGARVVIRLSRLDGPGGFRAVPARGRRPGLAG